MSPIPVPLFARRAPLVLLALIPLALVAVTGCSRKQNGKTLVRVANASDQPMTNILLEYGPEETASYYEIPEIAPGDEQEFEFPTTRSGRFYLSYTDPVTGEVKERQMLLTMDGDFSTQAEFRVTPESALLSRANVEVND